MRKLENVAKLAAIFKTHINQRHVILKKLVEDINAKILDLEHLEEEEDMHTEKKDINAHTLANYNISDYHSDLV